jgi:class 3 adenylate cyclase/tetratricopeptide (TPR) repeat protein
MTGIRPAERRQLTVMLCDMVASTALSLRLDPEDLAEVLQAYRQRCNDVITGHGGTVARQIGDAVLAYFGYPRAHENDAERAIRAGLAIAGTRWQMAGASDLRVHIGIATGVVVVGNLPQAGEELSAIGSALNLAARLQALAGPGMVVVSEQTRRLSRRLFEYRDLGRQDLKGYDEPVPAWQVIAERRNRSRFHALRASDLTPLVDRQRELEELRHLWDQARAGLGQALLMSSEPGVGKSRLTQVLAKRIVDRRCLRLWYHCSPNLQSSPLAPLVRQLTLAAGFSENDDDASKLRRLAGLVPDTAADAGEAVPLLADLLSVRYEAQYPPLGMSPQRQKQRLFQVLMQLVEAYAARGPVLMVVEDLHWIDPSSDELVGILIDRLRNLPVLAILTARPEFQSHWGENAHLHHMLLSPLERRDSIEMIGLLCGDRRIPESTIDQIADKTDGLPLFIEDLTKDVLESADVPADASGASRQGQGSFAIPATLNDSLMSRLDRLGSAKVVAEIGAVIGREFSYELLAKIADVPEDDLREELYRLVDAGLLVSRRSAAVLSYAFKHALVRDAAYSSLLKKKQVALHSRVARVLIDDFPETAESQPEVLAHHFQAANDAANAVIYLVKAAKLSARRSGFVEAIAQLESALRLLGTQPKSRERLRLELIVHRTLGGIYAEYRGFSSAECGRAYTAALELCRELGDAPEIFSVLSGLGSFEITRAAFATCQALAEECLSRATAQQSRPPFIMGHLLLGGTLFLRGELATARRHLEEALLTYEQDQAARRAKQVLYVQDQKSTGLCYLGLTLTILGRLDDGVRVAEEGLRHSRLLGGLHTINFSLCYLAAVHLIRGDWSAALECATRSLESAREQGFATWIGISQAIRGGALVSDGRHEEGLAELDRGIRGHTEIGAVAYRAFAMAFLAKGLTAAGRLDESLDTLSRALALVESTGERFYAVELMRLRGEVLARSGSAARAEDSLREAIDLARRQEARLFELRSAMSLCRLLEAPRRHAVLRDTLGPLCDWFAGAADSPDVQDARALLAGGMRSVTSIE